MGKIKTGCWILVSLVLTQCTSLTANLQASRDATPVAIRVCLVQNAQALRVTCAGGFSALQSDSVFRFHESDTLEFSLQKVPAGLTDASVDIRPDSTGFPLEWNRKKYRGNLRIVKQPDGSFQVTNKLPLEDYLRGVVPLEIGKRSISELEVLKVQSVAARTYAAKRLGANEAFGFDVFADVRDQVYGGFSAENENCDQAIRATSGEVMAYGDSLVDAYYHSTCGGRTERVENVWKNRPSADYLVMVRDQGVCQTSPLYRWEEVWTPSEMERIIKSHLKEGTNGYDPDKNPTDRLVGLKILSRFPSGRISALQITMTSGDYIIPSDRIRWVLRRVDHSLLKSSLFKLSEECLPSGSTRFIHAYGAGYGHGVGLCQWGAIEMGKQGIPYYQILDFYYPGSVIRQLY